MNEKKNKSKHELDLKLIKKHGFIENTEIKLTEHDFLTDENLEITSNINWTLFNKMAADSPKPTK